MPEPKVFATGGRDQLSEVFRKAVDEHREIMVRLYQSHPDPDVAWQLAMNFFSNVVGGFLVECCQSREEAEGYLEQIKRGAGMFLDRNGLPR